MNLAAPACMVLLATPLGCNLVANIAPVTVEADATTGDDASADAGAETSTSGDDGEAAACVKLPVSVSPKTGGAACPADTGACYPHSMTAWSPKWTPALGARVGACDDQQIAGYYEACMAPGWTEATCSAFSNAEANLTCMNCMVTTSGTPLYGVVVVVGESATWLNWPGCLALVEPCNVSCAQVLEASLECSTIACVPACTTTTTLSQCASESLTCTACESYLEASTCLQDIVGAAHPAYHTCGIDVQANRQASFTALAQYMRFLKRVRTNVDRSVAPPNSNEVSRLSARPRPCTAARP